MLHGFMITDGTVYYQSKLIQSPEYLNNKDPGKTLKTITWGTGLGIGFRETNRSLWRCSSSGFP